MRVNTIRPELLADQHLRAEYNEIHGMMIAYYRRSVLERKTKFNESEIPKNYILSKGHAMFFYDKMKFVQDRWYSIREECQRRGYVTNLTTLNYSIVKPEHMNSYEINYNDKIINLERILTRIYTKIYKQNKPNFYTFHKKPMKFLDWCILYTEKENIKQEDMYKIISLIENIYNVRKAQK